MPEVCQYPNTAGRIVKMIKCKTHLYTIMILMVTKLDEI